MIDFFDCTNKNKLGIELKNELNKNFELISDRTKIFLLQLVWISSVLFSFT